MASPNDYVEVLNRLSPRGSAWPIEQNSLWRKLLSAISIEFWRIDAAGYRLLNEAFPDTTVELLPDWERVAGLPDPCTGEEGTIEERRRDLLAKITSRGGQSIAYFIALAASIGYPITITEPDPFRCGSSWCGQPLNNGYFDFIWQVNAPPINGAYFMTGSSCTGEPLLRIWGNERLECVIRERAPAHTIVFFNYS